MGLGRVSEYPEGATWQPCEQQPPGTITLRTPVENFQILTWTKTHSKGGKGWEQKGFDTSTSKHNTRGSGVKNNTVALKKPQAHPTYMYD